MSDISHSTVIFQGYPWYMQNTKTYQQYNLHFSSSQPHRVNQAGSPSACTVKVLAFIILSWGEGQVYSFRWCWDQWPSIVCLTSWGQWVNNWVGECLCFGDDCSRGAAEQTKPASGADGPSSQLRAVNQGSVDWAVPVWWESLKGGIAWRCMLAQWSMLQCRCARCCGSHCAVRLE